MSETSATPAAEYRSADNRDPVTGQPVDGFPVVVGARFWNNDLRVCEVTRLEAIAARPYADTGETATWHDTTHGMFDTLTGYMRQYGRMARWFEGKDAGDYEPGTNYRDIK